MDAKGKNVEVFYFSVIVKYEGCSEIIKTLTLTPLRKKPPKTLEFLPKSVTELGYQMKMFQSMTSDH